MLNNQCPHNCQSKINVPILPSWGEWHSIKEVNRRNSNRHQKNEIRMNGCQNKSINVTAAHCVDEILLHPLSSYIVSPSYFSRTEHLCRERLRASECLLRWWHIFYEISYDWMLPEIKVQSSVHTLPI